MNGHSSFYILLMYIKRYLVNGQKCRHWPSVDAVASDPFGQDYLPHYLR